MSSPSAATVERWYLRLALRVSLVAWLALVLAELGWFRVWLILPIIALAAFGVLRDAVATGRAAARRGRFTLQSALGFGLLLLLSGVLFLPPFEAVVSGGDATVYVGFGRQIAETGRLEFEDELVRQLPDDVRVELFDNRIRGDATGEYARFPGGFQIPDIGDPSVTAGFSPLFPVLTALFYDLSSIHGALYVAPVFGMLSVGALLLVAAHFAGWRYGWLAVALTLAAMPQVWFARLPVPEMVAQWLVLSGLLAWVVALRDRTPRWAFASGWFFGLGCFAKVDLIVLLGVSLVAYVAWRLLAKPERGDLGIRYFPYLLVAFGLLLLHNFTHYLVFASHYRPYVEFLIEASFQRTLLEASGAIQIVIAVLAVLAVLGAVMVLLRRSARDRERAGGLALVALVVAYAVNYGVMRSVRLDDTAAWLSWYLSWPLLVAGAAALLWLAAGRASRDPGATLVVALLAVVGLHYLWNPLEPSVHIWAMRRFVPVVLPLLMLTVAMGVAACLDRVAPMLRGWAAAAAGLLLVALVARPTLALAGEPLWRGTVAQLDEFASRFPPRAVVVASPALAGTHLSTSLAYLHDIDTVLVQHPSPAAPLLEQAIAGWLASGRPVFLAFAAGDPLRFPAPSLTLSEPRPASIEFPMLEITRDRAPEAVYRPRIGLLVWRMTHRETPAVDIGNPPDDTFLFTMRGFHGPEQDTRADGTFRWTGAEASLAVPAGAEVTLTLASARPEGVPPAEVAVLVDGRPALESRILTEELEEIVVAAPPGSQPAELTIRSSVFNPLALGLEPPDGRDLGIQLYRVDFGPRVG
ncbi:MAG: hypothetical protein OXF93_19820 [Acidobacteria bacterium]|nr:hypothetical protein [Acidobacteriota bacterium]